MNEHSFDPTQFGLSVEPDVVLSLDDPDATRSLGERIARTIGAGGFVGLVGNLGAGKTTFTQGVCRGVAATEATSPTYTLLNVYRGDTDVFHFDLYRLLSVDELEGIGFWDMVESGAGISIVEWVDQIPEAWGGQGTIVHLLHDGSKRRARIWSTDSKVAKTLAK